MVFPFVVSVSTCVGAAVAVSADRGKLAKSATPVRKSLAVTIIRIPPHFWASSELYYERFRRCCKLLRHAILQESHTKIINPVLGRSREKGLSGNSVSAPCRFWPHQRQRERVTAAAGSSEARTADGGRPSRRL